ncbi:putative Ubiquitin-like domain-containing protein [Helianthus anomalus]
MKADHLPQKVFLSRITPHIRKSLRFVKVSIIILSRKTISLMVKPTDTIAQVKLEIEREEQIPFDEQALDLQQ